MNRRELAGPMLWHRCIAEAQLSRNEKTILWALIGWLDWTDTRKNTLWPSLSKIAGACSASEKTVRRTLNALRQKGVIEDRSARKGGIGPTGRGRPNELALSMSRLIELKVVKSTTFNTENMATNEAEAGRSGPQAGSECPEKEDNMTTNQTRIQTNQQPTDHTTPEGGVDGGDILLDRRKQAKRLLVDRGVSHAKAESLSATHPRELIEAAVSLTDEEGRPKWPRPGLLVWALENGEAGAACADAAERAAGERAEADRSAKDRPRVEACNRLWRFLAADAINRARANEIGPLIQEIWPRVERLAASQVLTDEELENMAGQEWRLLEKIASEAERLINARRSRRASG